MIRICNLQAVPTISTPVSDKHEDCASLTLILKSVSSHYYKSRRTVANFLGCSTAVCSSCESREQSLYPLSSIVYILTSLTISKLNQIMANES